MIRAEGGEGVAQGCEELFSLCVSFTRDYNNVNQTIESEKL